jgi:hypothetical protein
MPWGLPIPPSHALVFQPSGIFQAQGVTDQVFQGRGQMAHLKVSAQRKQGEHKGFPVEKDRVCMIE